MVTGLFYQELVDLAVSSMISQVTRDQHAKHDNTTVEIRISSSTILIELSSLIATQRLSKAECGARSPSVRSQPLYIFHGNGVEILIPRS